MPAVTEAPAYERLILNINFEKYTEFDRNDCRKYSLSKEKSIILVNF